MDRRELIEQTDRLYASALQLTRDDQAARELVQDTCLRALESMARGVVIDSPSAYLQGILRNLFNQSLRRKYRRTIVGFDSLPEMESGDPAPGDRLISAEEQAAVRRALTRLIELYRSVVIRYYVNGESVASIAKALNIPKGTVLSRLNAARQRMRKEVDSMKPYEKNSYQPDRLGIGISGDTGRNNEPFSCVNDLLDENILLLAYDKPVTVEALSQALGVSIAFIEDKVSQLIQNELMARDGSRVYTNFIIVDQEKDLPRSIAFSRTFAEKHFDTLHDVLSRARDEGAGIRALTVWDDFQRYLWAAITIIGKSISDIQQKNGLAFDFSQCPERPDGGKWYAVGQYRRAGASFSEDASLYNVSGSVTYENVSPGISLSCDWSTPFGRTHTADWGLSFDSKDIAATLDHIRTGEISAFDAQMIPKMIENGLVTEKDGRKVPAIGFLTHAEKEKLDAISAKYRRECCAILGNDARDIMLKNQLPVPAHIPPENISPFRYSFPLDSLAIAVVRLALERGLITTDGKPKPIMYCVLSD